MGHAEYGSVDEVVRCDSQPRDQSSPTWSSASVLKERAFPGLHASLMARIADLHLDAGSAILDFGCGTGAWLERLSRHGFTNLSGVDIERSGFGTDLSARFYESDLTANLDFGESTFELITAIEIVEHLADPEKLFKNAAQLLVPSGWLLLTTPNIYSLAARVVFLLTSQIRGFDPYKDPGHFHPLLLLQLEKIILPRYRLSLVEKWTYSSIRQKSKNPLSSVRRCLIQIASRIASRFIPNDLPGEALCLLLQKN